MMKIPWFVISGTTAVLMMGPALGQTHIQQVMVTSSGSSSSSQISTVTSSSTSGVGSSQRQETQISLNAVNLKQPYRLNVQTTTDSLRGEIKLNGRTIHQLEGYTNSLNLSSHLSVGENLLEITGSYSPPQSSVQISLVGPGTTLTQQVRGQGRLSNQIRISVRPGA